MTRFRACGSPVSESTAIVKDQKVNTEWSAADEAHDWYETGREGSGECCWNEIGKTGKLREYPKYPDLVHHKCHYASHPVDPGSIPVGPISWFKFGPHLSLAGQGTDTEPSGQLTYT